MAEVIQSSVTMVREQFVNNRWVLQKDPRYQGFMQTSVNVHGHWSFPSLEGELGISYFAPGAVADSFDNCGAGGATYFRIARDDGSPNSYLSVGSFSKRYDQAQLKEVLQAVSSLTQLGLSIPVDVFFLLLERCISEKDFVAGQEVHHLIMRNGLETDAFLGSHLIRMYGICMNLSEANEVFRKLSKPSLFSWSAIISAHVNLGKCEHAMSLYLEMKQLGYQPDGHVFVAVLKACSSIANLEQSKSVHMHIIECGFESDTFVGTTLIDMYAKIGSLDDACTVFDRLPKQNVVTWSVLIAGYMQHGHCVEAFKVFEHMQWEGIKPSLATFVCILKACRGMANLEQGRQVHTQIIGHGFGSDVIVGSALIDMYAKCWSLEDACLVFDRLHEQDVVTWSAMIAAQAQHGHGEQALKLFEKMQKEGIQANLVTFVSTLKACSNIGALTQGRQIHSCIIKRELVVDVYVGSALIDMYAKCGRLEDAQAVFDGMPKQNIVTWSALISAFAEHGHGQEAFKYFEKMQESGIKPNVVTLVCLLTGCSSKKALVQGRQIHASLIECGNELDTDVSNALIDMYAKCGSLEEACTMFDRLSERDVVTWTSLIAGYAEHGHGQGALQHFKKMQQVSIEPNLITFVTTLKACSLVAALEHGRQIHGNIVDYGLDLNVIVGSALIYMYAKCGSLEDAHLVFHRLPKQDSVVWTAMITGYAQHSNYSMAHRYFKSMEQAGFKPDNVTFLCIISACSHAGLLDEGFLHLKSMSEDYGITPTVEHFNSMVDLLGNLGLLEEAKDLLETIPFHPNIVGWTSLLSSCKMHANVVLGRQCFDHVLTMDWENAAGYVLMSNIYAIAGMQEDAKELEELRRCVNGWKKPGKAFIEVDNEIHCFTVGEKDHPQSDDIYAKLKMLSINLRAEGYRPCLNLVGESISEDKMEDASCGHCEKLAISFGLLCTPQGTTIRVAKNLRMCIDCHLNTKLISKIEQREIIVVDACCVHHFQHGRCSCKFYS